MDGVYQAVGLGLIRSLDRHCRNLRSLAYVHHETDIHQFMGVVNMGFGVNLGLEESVVLQELAHRIFSNGYSGGVVWIFVR